MVQTADVAGENVMKRIIFAVVVILLFPGLSHAGFNFGSKSFSFGDSWGDSWDWSQDWIQSWDENFNEDWKGNWDFDEGWSDRWNWKESWDSRGGNRWYPHPYYGHPPPPNYGYPPYPRPPHYGYPAYRKPIPYPAPHPRWRSPARPGVPAIPHGPWGR